jgi:ankyrin repeat protein
MANRIKTITALVVLLAGLMLEGCAPTFTPEFRRAVVNGDVRMVKSYLTTHPEWVNAKAEYGRTPLHEAVAPSEYSGNFIELSEIEIEGEVQLVLALREQPESVKLLIEEGANVNARDYSGQTPLHFAAVYGRMASTELLIENGANVNAKDHNGDTPLAIAVKIGHKEVVKFLRKHGAKE